jgi:hypothetical protein
MSAISFPCRLELRGHGDLIAHNAQELAAYEGMGWIAKPDTPPAFAMFPMFLRGPDLPDLLVENAAEAKAAADRGYRLPSDVQIEASSAAFAEAFEEVDEAYIAEEYPKFLSHPGFVPEAPGRWIYDQRGPGGLPAGRYIAGTPAQFAPVLVNDPGEEIGAVRRGWSIGSRFVSDAEALGAAQTREAPEPIGRPPEVDAPAPASPPSIPAPRKTKLSGAQRRRLERERRERLEQGVSA